MSEGTVEEAAPRPRVVRDQPVRDQPVVPEQTADDTDVGGGDWREAFGADDDERILRDRPPHW